jgi:hypothetical protein
MNAKIITGKNPEDIRSALEGAAKNEFHPTLGVVFVPSHFDFEGIVKVLDEHNIAIFGANTPDKFTDQGMENELATILLIRSRPHIFPNCYRSHFL